MAAESAAIPSAGASPAARPATRDAAYEAAKRALDVVGASAALTLGAPLFLTIAAAVRLSGRGPILFRQKRLGRGGRRTFLSENFAKPSFREKVSGCRPGRPGHITPCAAAGPAGR